MPQALRVEEDGLRDRDESQRERLNPIFASVDGGRMRWLTLVFWIVLCFLAAGIGARWTTPEITGWYKTLVRPPIAPPNWVFGPVWTTLYLLMALAAWLVSQSAPSSSRSLALILFLLQLALNLAWSWLFFHRHAIGGALVEILLLWAAIAATTLLFSRITPTSAWLMVPYLAWVSFACVLNAAFWRLN